MKKWNALMFYYIALLLYHLLFVDIDIPSFIFHKGSFISLCYRGLLLRGRKRVSPEQGNSRTSVPPDPGP